MNAKGIIILLLLPSLILAQLTAMPMKASLEMTVADTFGPVYRNLTPAGGSCGLTVVSPASHGTVEIIPAAFNNGGVSVPGFKYTPQAGFSGRDAFTWNISYGGQTSNTVSCDIVVHPAEPGGMTVLIIVRSTLVSSLGLELERLKSDLENEGYQAEIKPYLYTTNTGGVGNARAIWDSLRATYDLAGRFLAGAIIIGNMGINETQPFWCLSEYEVLGGSRDPSTGYAGANRYHLWVGMVNAAQQANYGDEITLLKRYFKANHEYRTGVSRLPHTVYCYPLLSNRIRPEKYTEVWPRVISRKSNADNPRDWIYNTAGGEIGDFNVNAGYTSMMQSVVAEAGYWNFSSHDIFEETSRLRVFLNGGCFSGTFAKHINAHLFTRNGATLLAAGFHGDNHFGHFSLADTTVAAQARMRAHLASGDRWGRAWIKSRMFLQNCNIFGDLSIKPMMFPDNKGPVITAYHADKTGGMAPLTVNFTSSAVDSDGTVANYEWYPEGLNWGFNEPVSAGSAVISLEHTFTKPYTYDARLEVVDNYLARIHRKIIVTVKPRPDQIFRVNCGRIPAITGSNRVPVLRGFHPQYEYRDPSGNLWLHEQGYVPGGWGYESSPTYSTYQENNSDSVNGSYAYIHVGDKSAFIRYRIPLPQGKYRVSLGFTGYAKWSTSGSIMDVFVQGGLWRDNFSSGTKSVTLDTLVSVTDSELVFELKRDSLSTGPTFLNWFTVAPDGMSAQTSGPAVAEESMAFHPNPFNPVIYIRYTLRQAGVVRAEAYDARGRMIKRIYSGTQAEGRRGLSWDGTDEAGKGLCSGVYFLRVQAGNREVREQVLLVR